MERLKIKKIIFRAAIFAVLVITVFPAIRTVAADDLNYTVLAPLPGTTIKENCVAGDPECKTNLEKYLPGVFNLAIGLSAAFAVLMIVIGGFQYISTDAIMKKEDGKKRIQNAVWGLVLVISAWLILSTINPDLLTLKLNIEPATTTSTPGDGDGGTLGGGGIFDPGIRAQAVDASPVLSSLLNCARENFPSGVGRISSISDSNNRVGSSGFEKCKTCPKGTKLEGCAHTCQSCHYGGGGTSQSYAVDFGDESNITTIGSTIISCASKLNIPQSSIKLINEGDHLHYEVGCK